VGSQLRSGLTAGAVVAEIKKAPESAGAFLCRYQWPAIPDAIAPSAKLDASGCT
jgi:hypothetical protein